MVYFAFGLVASVFNFLFHRHLDGE